MRLSLVLLNRPHKNVPDLLRFWQIDKPKAKPISKRVGNKYEIPRPVTEEDVQLFKEQMSVEYNVMRCLASPYLSKAQEEAYHRKFGTPEQKSIEKDQIAEYERMPNKPKVVSGNYKYDKLRGNIGNLLHEPQTVDRLFDRLNSQRPFE